MIDVGAAGTTLMMDNLFLTIKLVSIFLPLLIFGIVGFVVHRVVKSATHAAKAQASGAARNLGGLATSMHQHAAEPTSTVCAHCDQSVARASACSNCGAALS